MCKVSFFVQYMMGIIPRCYIPSFMEISPSVPEKIFEVFTIYGRGANLGPVTQIPRTNFCFPYPWRLHIKFGFDWLSGLRTDGWTPGHGYTISSPGESNSSGELKMLHLLIQGNKISSNQFFHKI